MSKLKTKKTISKRIRVTKSGKLIKRTSGQNHYNSKESGKVKRNKRSDKHISKCHSRTVRRSIPYS